LKSRGRLLVVEAFEEDFPGEVRNTVKELYRLYRDLVKPQGEEKETILKREDTLAALKEAGFKVLKLSVKEFEWFMTREEAIKYFGFKELPLDIPDKIWVHDKPKQVTIVFAVKE